MTAPAVATLRAQVYGIYGAYVEARRRANFAVGMGDHAAAELWDRRARDAEREFAAALRRLRSMMGAEAVVA